MNITLHGVAEEFVIRELATAYVRMTIRSRLPRLMWNHPRGSYPEHGQWVADLDRRRADYRRTLQSFCQHLPDVEQPEWRVNESKSSDGKFHPIYSPQRVDDAVHRFIRELRERL
jgi:hypothetical protein